MLVDSINLHFPIEEKSFPSNVGALNFDIIQDSAFLLAYLPCIRIVRFCSSLHESENFLISSNTGVYILHLPILIMRILQNCIRSCNRLNEIPPSSTRQLLEFSFQWISFTLFQMQNLFLHPLTLHKNIFMHQDQSSHHCEVELDSSRKPESNLPQFPDDSVCSSKLITAISSTVLLTGTQVLLGTSFDSVVSSFSDFPSLLPSRLLPKIFFSFCNC